MTARLRILSHLNRQPLIRNRLTRLFLITVDGEIPALFGSFSIVCASFLCPNRLWKKHQYNAARSDVTESFIVTPSHAKQRLRQPTFISSLAFAALVVLSKVLGCVWQGQKIMMPAPSTQNPKTYAKAYSQTDNTIDLVLNILWIRMSSFCEARISRSRQADGARYNVLRSEYGNAACIRFSVFPIYNFKSLTGTRNRICANAREGFIIWFGLPDKIFG